MNLADLLNPNNCPVCGHEYAFKYECGNTHPYCTFYLHSFPNHYEAGIHLSKSQRLWLLFDKKEDGENFKVFNLIVGIPCKAKTRTTLPLILAEKSKNINDLINKIKMYMVLA